MERHSPSFNNAVYPCEKVHHMKSQQSRCEREKECLQYFIIQNYSFICKSKLPWLVFTDLLLWSQFVAQSEGFQLTMFHYLNASWVWQYIKLVTFLHRYIMVSLMHQSLGQRINATNFISVPLIPHQLVCKNIHFIQRFLACNLQNKVCFSIMQQ